MRALLDVNVLIALFDAEHVHHEQAQTWYASHQKYGWASCPITENGFLRILSHPSYNKIHPYSVAEILESLDGFIANSNHVFWHDDLSLRDRSVFDTHKIIGSRQLTDLYLLGLAVHHKARLVTFDASIPKSLVTQAITKHLEVLGA